MYRATRDRSRAERAASGGGRTGACKPRPPDDLEAFLPSILDKAFEGELQNVETAL